MRNSMMARQTLKQRQLLRKRKSRGSAQNATSSRTSGSAKAAASPRKSKARSKSEKVNWLSLISDVAKKTLAECKAYTAGSSTTPKSKATKKAGRRSNTETPLESGLRASKSIRRRRLKTKA